MRLSYLGILVVFFGMPSLAQQKTQVTFPTTEEINLVVAQAQRAFEQYEKSVVMEKTLKAAKDDPSSIQKDEEVVEMSRKLIAGLKEHPEKFNGLGGLLLLSSLDDASRNSALCSGTGSVEIVKGLLEHADSKEAFRVMTIIQNCVDVSNLLFTVSESVHALMVREIEAQEDLNDQALELANKCNDIVRGKQAKRPNN